MAVRTSVDISVAVGGENDLDNCLFSRDLSELVDTLVDSKNETFLLAAGEVARQIDLGDVQQTRLIYIEADTEISAWFGGVVATAARITAVAGTYPTVFAGGETFIVTVNGTVVTTTFTAAASLLADVINEINSAAALAGLAPIAENVGGELSIVSPTTGSSSTVVIGAGTGNATLGMTPAAASTGTDPLPATSPVTLARLASPTGTSVTGLKAYLLATIQASAVYLTNPSASATVRGRILVVGDLVS